MMTRREFEITLDCSKTTALKLARRLEPEGLSKMIDGQWHFFPKAIDKVLNDRMITGPGRNYSRSGVVRIVNGVMRVYRGVKGTIKTDISVKCNPSNAISVMAAKSVIRCKAESNGFESLFFINENREKIEEVL